MDVPKKTTTGWQFKTLFFYKLNGGDYVKLKTSTIDAILKIVSGKKSFSSGSSYRHKKKAKKAKKAKKGSKGRPGN